MLFSLSLILASLTTVSRSAVVLLAAALASILSKAPLIFYSNLLSFSNFVSIGST